MSIETETRRAILGMPGYGEHTAGAGRGLWRASAGPNAKTPLDLQVCYSEGSLLAQNFNALWCMALNDRNDGKRVDYFAMLHADIEPEDGWLDKLIEELEARQLDVLGVPVPIKDPLGVTSIALARPDGDTWRPLCRLTMDEIFRLPETFTADDVGHPLLLNTGCWVCRFDPQWAQQVHFTINDRIVFNTKTNRYQAQVEPEDWYFSRLCHEQNLRLGVTRKVRLSHVGKARYVNYEPWGRENYDTAYVDASQIRGTGDGFRFPADVDGWLLPSEGHALANLAVGKRVLEIGSYHGRSTICLAQTAKEVISIDPHDGRGTPKPQPTLDKYRRNLERYGVANVTSFIGTLDNTMLAGEFDLAFIDGAHDYDSVVRDARGAAKLLKRGGLLAFHDYGDKNGVTRAVDELVSQGGKLVSVHTSTAVVLPPQP